MGRHNITSYTGLKNDYRDSDPRGARRRGVLASASGSAGTRTSRLRRIRGRAPRDAVGSFQQRLAAASTENYVVGAFVGRRSWWGRSVSGATRGIKQRHKARIWGVFVQEEHRGHGIARRLMAEVLRARTDAGGFGTNHPDGGRQPSCGEETLCCRSGSPFWARARRAEDGRRGGG